MWLMLLLLLLFLSSLESHLIKKKTNFHITHYTLHICVNVNEKKILQIW